MERDFFKSFRALSRPERMAVIRKDNPMGIAKQASSADLALMRRMDELHTNPPLLRRAPNGCGAAAGGNADGARPSAPPDAADGDFGRGAEAENQRQSPVPQGFSALAQGHRRDGAGSGLVRRHHLTSPCEGVSCT